MYCYIPLFVMADLCDGGPESKIHCIQSETLAFVAPHPWPPNISDLN